MTRPACINGRVYPIYDLNVLGIWDSWSIATKRYLEIVNELLEAAGSGERLYGTHGGNDGRCVLLTREMYLLLQSSRLITDTREMPYPPAAINSDGTIQW